MPALQRFAAHASHVVLYALMFALPLVGWGMLSAARYPIVDYGPLEVPPILPHDAAPTPRCGQRTWFLRFCCSRHSLPTSLRR